MSSKRDESATLTDDLITLVVGDKTYSADNEGTTAALGAGEDPLFLEDIGPDSTLESQVVFDVPDRVLDQKPQLRFGAEGFFSGDEAFIRLPPLQ